jgi:hypothetical protein
VAVGVDTGLLVAAAEGLAGTFRDG